MAIHGKDLLTEVAVRNAKVKEKTYMLRDGGGLWLVVEPTGRKWWKLRVVFAKKENSFSLGEYSAVTLSQARAKRDRVNSQRANGINPGAARKASKAAESGEGSFETVAREWIERCRERWSDSHYRRTKRNLERDAFPWIGMRPVGDITTAEVLTILRRVEKRSLETAHKLKITCGQVVRFGIQNGMAEADRDPIALLRGALEPIHNERMAYPKTPEAQGRLLRAIDVYRGTFVFRSALRLLAIVFTRPGTLAEMEWGDIDLEKALWIIPVERAGTKKPKRVKQKRRGEIAHIVTLPTQALEVLREIYPLTGQGRYVFPQVRNREKPTGTDTLTKALRIMGFTKEEISSHGFRHMASTSLHEATDADGKRLFDKDAVEKQMSHKGSNRIELIYNAAEYLPARRTMMQWYADHLDRLKAGEAEKIVPIRAAGV